MGQERIRALLLSILTEAGMEDLDRQALFVNTLVSGIATHYIDSGRRPTPEDRRALLHFCLIGLGSHPA